MHLKAICDASEMFYEILDSNRLNKEAGRLKVGILQKTKVEAICKRFLNDMLPNKTKSAMRFSLED